MSVARQLAGVAVLATCGACTALGPTPTVTTLTARPAERPDVELQVAAAPGYYLSSAVVEDPQGSGIQQLSAVLEPDRWLGVPGLIAGARVVGKSGDAYVEPLIGYRRTLGDADSLALLAVAHVGHSQATVDDASYEATRGGFELGADLIVVRHSWLRLHGLASVSAHGVSAEGDYCIDDAGEFARMCPDEPPTPPTPRDMASAGGVYGAASAGLALSTRRGQPGWYHGARLALVFAAGTMPRIVAGDERSAARYAAAGLALSLAFGAER